LASNSLALMMMKQTFSGEIVRGDSSLSVISDRFNCSGMIVTSYAAIEWGKCSHPAQQMTEELVTFAICIFRGVLCASRPLFQRGHQRVIFDDLPTWRFEYAWRAAP
jgi:hypothetical protein